MPFPSPLQKKVAYPVFSNCSAFDHPPPHHPSMHFLVQPSNFTSKLAVMDLCSISSPHALLLAKVCSFRQSPIFPVPPKLGLFGGVEGRALECPKGFGSRWAVVRATGKKNPDNSFSSGSSDQPSPEEGSPKESSPNVENPKSENPVSQRVHLSDWRTVRAHLVSHEQDVLFDIDAPISESSPRSKPLGLKWAHPISVPETGCLLIATEKLDGVNTFDRTVVLLLRSGTRDPRDGPFGVVINRPLRKKIKQMKPSSNDLAATFADCSLHFGGPLDASMFLLRTGEEQSPHVTGFEEVMPGLCYGAKNSLDEAANLVKKGILRAQDFKFFVGYAGWQFDQLRDEIESDYWIVVACSANLITGDSSNSSGLWEEILELMGGSYSELSKKPRQDGS